MAPERLTATDATFLYVETPHEPQHVGSLAILEGGPLRDRSGRIRIEEVRDFVSNRLHRVARMRQRVRMVPLRQGRPVWVDDERFDIEYHIRLTSLPQPGTDEQLLELMGRIQSLPLDRSRPLWEIWLVDGLADGNVAHILKVHHSMGDGMANVDLVMALIDIEADAPLPEPGPAWAPEVAPSDLHLLASALVDQARRPTAVARNATSAIRDPRRFLGMLRDLTATAVQFTDQPRPAAWNTPISAQRRWEKATASMDQVRAIRRAADCDATLNDVVLAACTGALREFMADRGDDVEDERTVRAMVPVSRRGDDEHGTTLGNKVSLIVVELPVYERDPARRLAVLSAQTRDLKGSGMADGAETLLALGGEVPMLAPALARAFSRRIPVNLTITNIPGPPVPLWMYGARVLEAYPYVEVIDALALTIAVVSYEGVLHFGITADRHQMPDLAKLAKAVERNFDEMEQAFA